MTTSLKVGAAFPTDHPLHVDAPQHFTKDELTPLLKEADVILSLDWVDLAGTLRPLGGPPAGKVIQISLDHQLHNGWSMDYQALPPVDLFISADPDTATAALVAGDRSGAAKARPARRGRCIEPTRRATRALGIEDVAHALRGAVGGRDVTLTHLPLSWQGSFWYFRHPLDFVGSDGGGGVGGGPGHFGRRRAGAEGIGPAGDRDLRRRRFSDERDVAMDCGALPHSRC